MDRPNTLTRTGMLTVAALAGSAALAQFSRVQVIHNSADAAAATVDVWLDNSLIADDFAFRTASAFTDVPGGTYTIGIAPANSTVASDAIYTQNVTLVDGETYVVVANGIVSASGYMPAPAFNLDVFTQGRETAMMPGNTDILAIHGSTDAPTVDVYESGVLNTTAIDDISYTDFAGYLELPTADYTLQVRTADNSTIVAAYSAPLATLNLQGAALTVVASGFLDPSMNSNGPAFGLFVAAPTGGPLLALPAAAIPTARVQVIHNSADAAASTVDVWLNNTLLLDDFAFRTASPFVDAQAGVDLTVGIAPSNSTLPSDAIAQFNYNLSDGETYIIVANGIVSPSGYMPAPAFNLDVFAQGRETAMMPGNTDIVAIHGSTDAPTVDIYESGVLNTTAIDDLSYPDFAGYLELPTDDYTLEVRTADNSTIVAAYSAPLATLNLQGAALTVLASGFLDPSMNSNGPAFGLFVATAAGGPLLALPAAAIPTARVQVIHNSADAAAATVDVWLNNTLLLDDFDFRTASPFVDAQAGVDLTVGIAPSNSTMPSDAIAQFNYNLGDGETYIIVANGIVSTTGYTPNQPFDLYVYADARETATSGATNTDILVFHGSTDAPTVDITETAVLGGATLVSNLSYGNFAPDYLEPPTNDYTLLISSGGNPVAAYDAPLSTLGLDGAAITVLASGFLDPSMNSNGAPFGLFAATAAGGPLVALPLSTGIEESSILSGLVAWPNPVNDQLFVDLNTVQSFQASMVVTDMTGRVVLSQEGLQVASGESRMVLDLNDLSTGLYQLSIVGTDILRTIPVQVMR